MADFFPKSAVREAKWFCFALTGGGLIFCPDNIAEGGAQRLFLIMILPNNTQQASFYDMLFYLNNIKELPTIHEIVVESKLELNRLCVESPVLYPKN